MINSNINAQMGISKVLLNNPYNQLIANNEKTEKIKSQSTCIQNNQIAFSPIFINQMSKQLQMCPVQMNKKVKISKPHPKTKFTPDEDSKLLELVQKYGENNMYEIAQKMDGRNIRQCRERWRNYLSPKIDNGPWTKEDDDLLFKLLTEYGPKWKCISKFFPKRTDISVKSRFNIYLRRYIKQKKNSLKQYLQQQQVCKYNCNYYNPNLFCENYYQFQIKDQSLNNYVTTNIEKNQSENQANVSPSVEDQIQKDVQDSTEKIYTDDMDSIFDEVFDMTMMNSREFEFFEF